MAKPVSLKKLRQMAKGHSAREDKRDQAADKRQGIREGSALDKKLDRMGRK